MPTPPAARTLRAGGRHTTIDWEHLPAKHFRRPETGAALACAGKKHQMTGALQDLADSARAALYLSLTAWVDGDKVQPGTQDGWRAALQQAAKAWNLG